MTERWKQVDDYFMERVVKDDAVLTKAVERAGEEGLPPIQVSGPQGKLLELLVVMMGAQRVLEIGTLAGYSTIRLARGVGEGGAVVTLELDPHHASVARENLERAGLSGRVELREGRAIDSLDRMIAEGVEPFDFFFIDADKSSNPTYLERAVACRVDRARSSSSTTSCVTAGSWTRGVTVLTSSVPGRSSTCFTSTHGSRPPPSRWWGARGTTALPWRWWDPEPVVLSGRGPARIRIQVLHRDPI